MTEKKLVFKIRQFPHLSETFILAQIITAIKCGYDVRLLINDVLDFESSKQKNLIEKYDIDKKIIIENYKIPKNKIIRLFRWSGLLFYNLKNLKQIFRYHKEYPKFSFTWLYQWDFYRKFDDVDIFHIQYGTNSSLLATLKKIGFKPSLMVSFHGHDAFFPINGFIANDGYYDNLFKYGDLVIANTPYLAEKITALGCPEEKLKIIPVGVDTDFFYAKAISEKRDEILKLITVGRLDPVKGHSYCIEAVKHLIKRGVNVTLTIVGEGAERGNLKKMIAENHLENHVFMIGRRSQSEIRQLLWEHDLYLLTAVALPDGRRETQGLATLEAQACGLPVLVFDSGGVKYTVENGKTGFVCREYDVNDVVSNIEFFWKEPIKLKMMGKYATDFIKQNYDQKVIDTTWEVVYHGLNYKKNG